MKYKITTKVSYIVEEEIEAESKLEAIEKAKKRALEKKTDTLKPRADVILIYTERD